jgi:hypothetical protein
LVLPAHKAFRVFRVYQVRPGPRARPVHKVPLVHRDLPVRRDLWVQ